MVSVPAQKVGTGIVVLEGKWNMARQRRVSTCKVGVFRSLRVNFRVSVICTMKAPSWPNVGND